MYRRVICLFIPMLLASLIIMSCSEKEDDITIVYFRAHPETVFAAEAVTLDWEANGADHLSIEPDIGDVTGKTSITVYPLKTTTFILTVKNDDVTEMASAQVTTSPAGYVYRSNPITATGDLTLRDENDQTNTALDAARTAVPMSYLEGSGRLVGQYADLSATGIYTGNGFGYDPPPDYNPGSVVTTTDSYHFSRDTFAFSEVNCYYHITAVRDLLVNLGFSGINDRAVPVHAFYFPERNAFYSSYDNGLHFGYHYADGPIYIGPDATEDAEVIVHELGHAIQANQSPYWGYRPIQGAMGEGFSDFIGQIGSGDARYPMYLGEWFAHLSPQYTSSEGIPYLRPLNVDWIFPDDIGIVMLDDPTMGTGVYHEVHYDGMIWSASLLDVHNSLEAVHGDSSNKTLALVLQSHYAFPQSLREAAAALLNANAVLFAGEDQALLTSVLTDRGLFAEPSAPCGYPITILPAGGTMQLQTYAPLVHYAEVTIDGGYSSLKIHSSVDTSNPQADIDLYGRKGGVHYYDFDVSSTGETGVETITFVNPEPGTYGICIHAYSYSYYSSDGMVTYSLTTELN